MTSSPPSVFFIFLLLTLLLTVSSDLKEDTNALLKFMDNVFRNESKLTNWSKEEDTCKWTGVTCDLGNSSVIFLRLPRARLVGKIPPDSLGKITTLQNLSLHDNKLSGTFPADFASLTELKNVSLQNNQFSGLFPPSVANWSGLLALNLSGNNFHGGLPGNLPSSIEDFSVSNNNFIGHIPKNLTKFPEAAFSGNIYLCVSGYMYLNYSRKPFTQKSDLPPCEDTVISRRSQSPFDSLSLNHKKEEKLCTAAIVVTAVGSALILLLLLSYLRKEYRAVKEKNAPGVARKAADAAKAKNAPGVATKAAARGFGKLD